MSFFKAQEICEKLILFCAECGEHGEDADFECMSDDYRFDFEQSFF